MAAFFAIFYVDDAYLASWDAGFLQHLLDILANLFKRVSLQTKTSKTQTMICTPGRIWMQLLTESYWRVQRLRVTAGKWNAHDVKCRQCGKELKASSLGCHLADDVHDIYQQAVVAKALLEVCPPVTYTVSMVLHARALSCPYPGCEGHLRDEWMMRRHFRDVHPMDLVKVPKEGKFGHCKQCGMQVHPMYPRHRYTKECQIEVKKKHQQETAVLLALALCQKFLVCGNMLEWVEVYQYLGRLLAQDDDDIQAIRTQMQKA
jgi:hypothetical protein